MRNLCEGTMPPVCPCFIRPAQKKCRYAATELTDRVSIACPSSFQRPLLPHLGDSIAEPSPRSARRSFCPPFPPRRGGCRSCLSRLAFSVPLWPRPDQISGLILRHEHTK